MQFQDVISSIFICIILLIASFLLLFPTTRIQYQLGGTLLLVTSIIFANVLLKSSILDETFLVEYLWGVVVGVIIGTTAFYLRVDTTIAVVVAVVTTIFLQFLTYSVYPGATRAWGLLPLPFSIAGVLLIHYLISRRLFYCLHILGWLLLVVSYILPLTWGSLDVSPDSNINPDIITPRSIEVTLLYITVTLTLLFLPIVAVKLKLHNSQESGQISAQSQ